MSLFRSLEYQTNITVKYKNIKNNAKYLQILLNTLGNFVIMPPSLSEYFILMCGLGMALETNTQPLARLVLTQMLK